MPSRQVTCQPLTVHVRTRRRRVSGHQQRRRHQGANHRAGRRAGAAAAPALAPTEPVRGPSSAACGACPSPAAGLSQPEVNQVRLQETDRRVPKPPRALRDCRSPAASAARYREHGAARRYAASVPQDDGHWVASWQRWRAPRAAARWKSCRSSLRRSGAHRWQAARCATSASHGIPGTHAAAGNRSVHTRTARTRHARTARATSGSRADQSAVMQGCLPPGRGLRQAWCARRIGRHAHRSPARARAGASRPRSA